MSAEPAELTALRERAVVLNDLDRIGALLFWDQNTMMPPRGAAARGEPAATLQTVARSIRRGCRPTEMRAVVIASANPLHTDLAV